MADFKQVESKARAWAAAHVVIAILIGVVIGFLVRSAF